VSVINRALPGVYGSPPSRKTVPEMSSRSSFALKQARTAELGLVDTTAGVPRALHSASQRTTGRGSSAGAYSGRGTGLRHSLLAPVVLRVNRKYLGESSVSFDSTWVNQRCSDLPSFAS
jgi:hypothetical protein